MSVCLSVAYRPTSGLSREQRGLGRLKLAQRSPTSHVTETPLSRSKDQRSRSPGRFTHRGLNESGSCSGERGNVLGVGNYCYVAVCASAPTEGGEGRGISWRLPAYSLFGVASWIGRNLWSVVMKLSKANCHFLWITEFLYSCSATSRSFSAASTLSTLQIISVDSFVSPRLYLCMPVRVSVIMLIVFMRTF